MTLAEGRNLFQQALKNHFQNQEIDFYFKSILRKKFDREPTQLALEPNTKFKKEELAFLNTAIVKLSNQQPLQYLLEEADFRNLRLKVNEKVLIPRPETEELVDWILEDHQNLETTKALLEVGTGSGCMAVALAKEQANFSVTALDLDTAVLEVALQNAVKYNVQIEFIQQDILHANSFKKEVDIIVSNPPYVLLSEKKKMQKNVLDYEPHQALFVPEDDPLIFYRAILEFAQLNLKPKGLLYFEINPLVLDQLIDLIKSFKFQHSQRMDIFGNVRMLRLQKKRIWRRF